MKSIQLLDDVVIAGVRRTPDDDPFMLDTDAANALITAKLAEESDDLDKMKLDELTALAAAETVNLGEASRKVDIAAAIRAHRALAAG
ncbi:hypothetical protein [Sphingomonas nostoxanthinifaciens]|uniref:hypothetical protein n=1 Tax=Sphingomonas nostoxanthinifaciens TaxID=2872652 RepID=UPI001CC1E7D7|nr:hypothetical protein [Sphingomonas nostoxanthinifaciens]UAK24188.1 hypothetical protein K8P63_17955 [Sphingomonas nostoxanthinifaciens]